MASARIALLVRLIAAEPPAHSLAHPTHTGIIDALRTIPGLAQLATCRLRRALCLGASGIVGLSYTFSHLVRAAPDLGNRLLGTALEKVDQFHVIARTAFGKLYLWGEKTGPTAEIVTSDHSVLCLERDLKKPVKNPELALRRFFSGSAPTYADALDENGQPLFQRALDQLGPLPHDETYGFEPALVIGGKPRIENVRIVKMIEHLGMLRHLAGPQFPMGSLNMDKFV